MGSFSKDFLKLPDIVTITEMQEHQRYFPLENIKSKDAKNKGNKLANQFLIVFEARMNLKRSDQSIQNIRSGNERVLASRLSDGMFFFNEDRKKTLFECVEQLKNITYQEGLGNIFDKKERLKQVTALLIEHSYLNLAHFGYQKEYQEDLERACDLAKADLTTNLVYEFDSLQGKIGSIYAHLDGEKPEVCQAIYEHYLPRYQGDEYPKSYMGIIISLADKFDHLICSFLMGREPTATHDPLGIRRQTIYIIEIIIQNKITLKVLTFLEAVFQVYMRLFDQSKERNKLDISSKELQEKIWNFFRGRFATIFEKKGFDKKLIRASLFTQDDNIGELYFKLLALTNLQKAQEFSDIMLVFKRMNNIVEGYLEKNPHFSEKTLNDQVNENLLQQEEEKNLYSFAKKLKNLIQETSSHHNKKNQNGNNKEKNTQKIYESIFSSLAGSKKIVDSFFDHVMVMHEDEKIKMNRLALLQYITTPVKILFNLKNLQ